MKKKILIIFFLTLIPLYLIYSFNHKETYIYLAIGDELAKGHTPFNTYGESYTDYLFTYLKTKNPNAEINKKYIDEDMRITDLIKSLKNIEENSLTQDIKKSDIITISIGSEEIFNKLKTNYTIYKTNPTLFNKYIDTLFINLTELLKEMRKYTNKPIYIIGYYSPIEITEENATLIKSMFNYIDLKFKELENKYNIKYINIYEGFKNNKTYIPNINHTFPSLEGYNYISNEIIKKLES